MSLSHMRRDVDVLMQRHRDNHLSYDMQYGSYSQMDDAFNLNIKQIMIENKKRRLKLEEKKKEVELL